MRRRSWSVWGGKNGVTREARSEVGRVLGRRAVTTRLNGRSSALYPTVRCRPVLTTSATHFLTAWTLAPKAATAACRSGLTAMRATRRARPPALPSGSYRRLLRPPMNRWLVSQPRLRSPCLSEQPPWQSHLERQVANRGRQTVHSRGEIAIDAALNLRLAYESHPLRNECPSETARPPATWECPEMLICDGTSAIGAEAQTPGRQA